MKPPLLEDSANPLSQDQPWQFSQLNGHLWGRWGGGGGGGGLTCSLHSFIHTVIHPQAFLEGLLWVLGLVGKC